MNIVAIIEARMASTRLPGKVLLPLLGEPMLGRMVERLYGSKCLYNIVVAITDTGNDQNLVYWWYDLKKYIPGISRGSEADVLGRVLVAAEEYCADIIVELTGDCPLIDPAMVDKVVADYLLGGADFVCNHLPYTAPRGMDVRVFSTDALAKVDKLTDDPADREHVSLYFWEHPEIFRIRNVTTDLPEIAKTYRLTVDTAEDYELVKTIFEKLYPTNPRFTLYDILELLEREPELAYINQHVEQKAVR